MHDIVLIYTLLVFLQKMIVVSLLSKMATMKILVLDSIGLNLDVVVDFLKCFPCLNKLYIIMSIHLHCFKQHNHHYGKQS
jgi:hypothetical protein